MPLTSALFLKNAKARSISLLAFCAAGILCLFEEDGRRVETDGLYHLLLCRESRQLLIVQGRAAQAWQPQTRLCPAMVRDPQMNPNSRKAMEVIIA